MPHLHSDISPLPARRRDISIAILVVGVAALYLVGLIVGLTHRNEAVPWASLGQIGSAISADASEAAERFAGWAIALFGASLGGQVLLQADTPRATLRRVIGALGIVLAIAAFLLASLTAIGISQTSAAVSALPSVLAGGAVTWVLGVECGRFVVPDFDRQRATTVDALTHINAKLDRLPRPARTLHGAYGTLAGWSILVALIAPVAVVRSSAVDSGIVFALEAVFLFASLSMLTQLTASTMTEPSRGRRILSRGFWFAVYTVLILFSSAVAILVAPEAPVAILVATTVELLLPIGFLSLARGVPQPLIDMSLGGALGRVAMRDLERARESAQRRLVELDEILQRQGGRRHMNDKIADAIAALRS
ncbi:hypothetical protein [Curtobacterium sp. ISL-83]|uniref:hypothetical protein n=1 Tax=Curtobacterium sp. ISL-83 TaxID=2819145 RepID=UPI001BE78005|nr:hypothetical protein [Curtobacterium sp. ISL-83]MBT2501527.1 hypothetical protein [Curtobacterium sp. ISL-83]